MWVTKVKININQKIIGLININNITENNKIVNINVKTENKLLNPNLSPIKNTNLSVSSNNRMKKRISGIKNGLSSKEESQIPRKKYIKNLTSIEREQIKSSLTTHFLFKDKGPNIIYSLLRKIELINFEKNVIIFQEGGTGDYFYIIKEGSVECFCNGVEGRKILRIGETFGELALLERKKRTETVKTIEPTILYELDGKTFRDIVKTINKNELIERLKFISLVPIFSSLESIQLNSLASSMFKMTFDEGQYVFYEKDVGDSVYIIKDGELECEKNKEVIRILKSGQYFGEFAILFDIPRTLSCKAKNKLTVYKISNSLLEETFGCEYKDLLLKSIIKEAFSKSDNLRIFSEDSYIEEIYLNTSIKVFQDKNIVIKKEEFNKSIHQEKHLFVVIGGNLIHQKSDNEIEIIGKRGQLFGEKYIRKKHQIEYDVIAQGEVRLIVIKWINIEKIFHFKSNIKNVNKTITFFSQLQYLKKSQLFRNTSDNKLIKICHLMTKEKYNEGDIILKEGEIGDKFYLIKKGKVKVVKSNKYIRILEVGNCFGETSLLIHNERTATIIAEDKCTFYVLEKKVFDEIMDKNMLDYLKKKIALQDNFQMKLEDLYYCKSLGQGKFGIVTLVHDNKHFYAIKAVDKKLAERQKILIKYFLEERKVLLQLDHPFIMKLVRTFKNNENIFYLLEYIHGKSLSKYISSRQQEQLKNKTETRFFISFLLVILNYLNSKNIIHRDLKPDNIMIDNNGYLKIIDFGTAVCITNFTSTMTGTPHYISPEVLMGKGYSFSCDYWSVGIITHEIYYNFYPFGNNSTDPIDVYKEVLKKEINLPLNGEQSVNSFIKCLLKKIVSKRICNFESLKKHAFFKGFNWGDLIDFQMVPPYFPFIEKVDDFNSYKVKYLQFLENDKLKNTKILNSLKPYDEDENLTFENNWDEEF